MNISVRIVNAFLILGFSVTGHSGTDVLLTKNGLEEMAQEVERAASRRDVHGVFKYISPDIRVIVKTRGRAGDQTVSMDYETYKARLERSWAAARKYIYKREKLDINVSPDRKEATLIAIIREVYVLDGRTSSGRARETTTVRLIQGKPMIIAVLAEQLEE